MGIKAGSYDVSFYARSNNPSSTTFTLGLYNKDGSQTFGTSNVSAAMTSDWKQFKTTIKVAKTAKDANNVFGIDIPASFTDSFQVNLLSVSPSKKWKSTTVREDFGSLINDLKPKYFRAIGGNALEGNNLASHYDWQKAIGPLTNRAGRAGTWVGWVSLQTSATSEGFLDTRKELTKRSADSLRNDVAIIATLVCSFSLHRILMVSREYQAVAESSDREDTHADLSLL